MRFLIILALLIPRAAYAGVASATFNSGGPGFAIVQLLLIAAVGALCCIIAQGLKQGQIASMIKLLTIFCCISVIVKEVVNAISAVANAFNIAI